MELVSIDTHSLVQAVAADLAPLCEERRQRIDIRIDPAAATIRVDPAKLHDALRNLLANACTYGPPDSAITVTAAMRGRSISIAVADEGSGIPAEHLPRIFDRFYRVPRPNKKDIEGFGIGLFYVRKICDLHKWKINISNNEGSGITISIHIPKSSIV